MKYFLFAAMAISIGAIPAGGAPPPEDEPPRLIVLDSLAHFYEPVRFDHQLHIDYADCAECHHHTTASPATDPRCTICHTTATAGASVACRNCHGTKRPSGEDAAKPRPSHRYHIDIVSLAGAYHINCLDCHQAVDAGPIECIDCHAFTEEGKKFFHLTDSLLGSPKNQGADQ
ncbi:MAG: cytochrome c3 family protein [Desulfofustis sp. PB-SRB1]|jgi:hypothetical protein|nr:cytochrome c3 family protein [Desulfofustis sp. PB-SRB1]MBM1001610.1 cytochrome c3 family protein [Desulfofustis sp. PB-SRB1]HBH27938.1 class III cytochrome C [Desulfofustis sp.]HBH30682.1 class III cytochrome C [Desulfofustis sp.]